MFNIKQIILDPFYLHCRNRCVHQNISPLYLSQMADFRWLKMKRYELEMLVQECANSYLRPIHCKQYIFETVFLTSTVSYEAIVSRKLLPEIIWRVFICDSLQSRCLLWKVLHSTSTIFSTPFFFP